MLIIPLAKIPLKYLSSMKLVVKLLLSINFLLFINNTPPGRTQVHNQEDRTTMV